MKLVICDDDATLRTVVSRMAEAAGHTVIAETDNGSDVVELVSRFDAGALVLDLSLPYGSGLAALRELRARGVQCQAIVFTAYGEQLQDATEAGAWAVVEKPDFDALDFVLQRLETGAPTPTEGVERERRRPRRERPAVPPPGSRSPSGLEDPESLTAVIEALEPGDAVMYVHVSSPETSFDPWTRLLHTDRFLAVARLLRAVLRVQDRVAVESDQLLAVLLDAERAGVESAWRRLEAAHARSGIGGVLSAGWSMSDGDQRGYAVQAHARDAALRSVGRPPGDRLWAG